MADIHELHDAYRALEIDPVASPLAIKRQYKRLVKRWHPDQYPVGSRDQKRAGEQLQKINLAYQRIRHAPLRYRSPRTAAVAPTPSAAPPADVKAMYEDGELFQQYWAAHAEREARARRAAGWGFGLVATILSYGAWK